MAKFLCITLNPAIDLTISLPELHIGQINKQQSTQSHAAGKGLNVAQVLRDLGHDIVVSGFLGDANAVLFENHFAKQGFENHFVYVNGETRTNIKIAEQNGRTTDINGKGFTILPENTAKLLQKLPELAQNADFIVVSGSLPQQFSDSDWQNLLQTLMQANPRVAVDTSGSALASALACRPYLVKPNNDELADILGIRADTAAEQAALFQQTTFSAEHLVISMGENGVNWLHGNRILHATIAPVEVKSTVGAGDTLLAGILHGMAAQRSDTEILQTAAALAANAVNQIGFRIPTPERLAELENMISVKYLT